jgi:hypothetical protein
MTRETFLNINRSKDSNADNGMMTKVWGPPGWLFLHCITFGYPYIIDEFDYTHFQKKNEYKQFFNYLGKVFPCLYCRESYDKFMKELPIDNFLSSRKDLCLWLYLMHNKVNDKLGVPKCDIPSFKELQQKYESYRAECKKTTEKERLDKKAQGCITPADGIKKKSYLEVVNTKENNNYMLIRKDLLIIIIIIIIIYFIISMFKFF